MALPGENDFRGFWGFRVSGFLGVLVLFRVKGILR
jgi:hypothetical protein